MVTTCAHLTFCVPASIQVAASVFGKPGVGFWVAGAEKTLQLQDVQPALEQTHGTISTWDEIPVGLSF